MMQVSIEKVKPIIRQIVGKCHVGASHLQVLRKVIGRIKKGVYKRLPRVQRRKLIRIVYQEHNKNRKLYRFVMGGR